LTITDKKGVKSKKKMELNSEHLHNFFYLDT